MKMITITLFGLFITLIGVLSAPQVGISGEVTGAGFMSEKKKSLEEELKIAVRFKASKHSKFYKEGYLEKNKASI